MNYTYNPMEEKVQYRTFVDPFMIERLKKIVGRSVVLETVRGNLQGVLVDVKPDHIVVQAHGDDTIFFVRIQQIVYVMPD